MICSHSIISAAMDRGQAARMSNLQPRSPSRQTRLILLFPLVACLLFVGCTPPPVESVAEVWGRKGLDDGRFIKPRAIAVDESDQLYIIDMTSRIQVFDHLGKLQNFWKTPECVNGKPCGISILRDGRIAVPDTHYFRVLFYTPEGQLLSEQTIGGQNGRGEGEFGFLTDVVEDSQGNLYVSEYGDFDRIQKFTSDGKYICSLGAHGTEEGEFLRPQGMLVDEKDQLWVADACNHRIQVFDATTEPPTFKFSFGSSGSGIGELSYPYNMLFDGQGFLYVCEFGNHRLQKFDLEGNSHGIWGGPGREPGQLHQPWGMTLDSQGYFHVIDSYNHRVQRFKGVAKEGEPPIDCWQTE
ncbi:Serine/threonine-protein kinase PknD [Mariniblastus fucicola]|uniref:Serine/threonine-protein kinase PknD n=2 Tax=Mariniblastus fucicola TaxID=980251 RepID=A0A5B9PKI9_9BACT|nr:Serine/threonine-protein kinase PknD [Mariniblastus fucicola]